MHIYIYTYKPIYVICICIYMYIYIYSRVHMISQSKSFKAVGHGWAVEVEAFMQVPAAACMPSRQICNPKPRAFANSSWAK